MTFRGFLLAGALALAPVHATAAPPILHPAEPDGSAAAPPYASAFEAPVLLLDRAAPHPSYGPAPEGALPEEPAPAMPMDHGAMGHGAMNHGAMPGMAHPSE